MDPYERLRSAIVNKFSFRELIPWLLVIVIVAICLAVYANETFSSDNKDYVDCVYSEWSPYRGCENNDCTGVGIRSRTILKATERCTSQLLYETKTCKEIQNCLLPDCQYSTWSTWSDCPNVCFNNDLDCNTIPSQIRFRNVIRPALPGGVPCDWASLVQERECVVQQACPPNQDCVASPPNPALDCNECPDVGCTLTNQSYWTMCTASILQSQSGTGAKCSRNQILYSQTCPLPDCREECIGNDYGYFQKCTVPCGNGYSISSNPDQCPNITVGSCSNGSCSAGAFELTTYTVNTSCTIQGATFCRSTDNLSFSQCLAQAVADPNVDLAYSVSTGVYLGSSKTMTCNLNGTDSCYEWNSFSTECVPPTWDMVNAVCLFLCDAKNPNHYSIERGIAFPFSNGSVSCPINPYLLSISNVCPIQNQTLQGRLFGSAQFPNSSTTYRSITDPYTNQSYSLLCPMTKDCVYQSWTDAPVWNICQNPCAEGGGTRFRYRSIITPASFMGIPCDTLETVESVPCNLQTSITSATSMWCSYSAASFYSTSSELNCQLQCSTSRNPLTSNSCDSMFMIYQSHTDGNREIFLASTNPPSPLTQGNLFSFVNSFRTSGDASAQLATYNELENYFKAGGQTCQIGWYQKTAGDISSLRLGASVKQVGCGGSLSTPGLYVDQAGTASNFAWISSQNKSFLYSKSLTGNLLLPFFSTTNNTSSPLGTSYTFVNQSFSDNVQCALEAHRTDFLLLANSCTSFSGKPASKNLVTSTMLLDVPCDIARDCSLSAWKSVTSCGACLPPYSYVETRTIIQRATEGGNSCDNYSLVRTVPCPTSLPKCDTGKSISVCIADQFPQKPGTTDSACDLMSQTYPFLEAWNPTFVYALAQVQQQSATNLFTYIKSMTTGVAMPNDLAIALNAQPLNSNGSAPLCIQGVNSVTRDASGNIYEFSISSSSKTAFGWKISSCVPNDFASETLFNRVSISYTSITKRYYNVNNNNWTCPSACGYTSETCIFDPPGSCSCGLFSQTAETGFRPWALSSDLYCKTTSTVAAIYRVPCPNPYVSCASTSDCPIGCDGSPCSSKSGLGICSLTSYSALPFYQCVCNNGSLQKDCSIDCPYGSNGQTCSGHGTCNSNGICTCDPLYSGFACDQYGTAMLGLMEGLLYNAQLSYTVVTNSTTKTGTVTAKNLLPCEDQNNPACNQVQFQNTDTTMGYELPILSLVNNAAAVRNANMCINSGDGLFNDNWIPSYMTMMSIGSLSCASMSYGGIINENFTVTCRFLNNPNVPPSLVGKQFNLRCMNSGNTVNSYTYYRPAQFDSNNRMIFEVLGYGQKTLNEVCGA